MSDQFIPFHKPGTSICMPHTAHTPPISGPLRPPPSTPTPSTPPGLGYIAGQWQEASGCLQQRVRPFLRLRQGRDVCIGQQWLRRSSSFRAEPRSDRATEGGGRVSTIRPGVANSIRGMRLVELSEFRYVGWSVSEHLASSLIKIPGTPR